MTKPKKGEEKTFENLFFGEEEVLSGEEEDLCGRDEKKFSRWVWFFFRE